MLKFKIIDKFALQKGFASIFHSFMCIYSRGEVVQLFTGKHETSYTSWLKYIYDSKLLSLIEFHNDQL